MKKAVQLLFIAGLVILKTTGYSQTVIEGEVRSGKGSPIPGATIKIRHSRSGTATDSLGKYSFSTKTPGSYWLMCTALGYRTDSVFSAFKGDSIHIDFKLQELKNDLAGVSIHVQRRLPELKREYTLNDFDVATTAGAAADVAAALQTFPGASPAGNETGLFVHGGSANETQAFFDGMLVKNVFGSRLPDVANRSRFSAFLFDKTTFSTNGYSAKYGQALSSAMVLETKGLANKTSTEVSAISLGIGAAHTERFKNSSLVVGGNYYNFGLNNELIGQNINWQQNPRQYQGMIHYKQKTSANGMLKFFTDYSDTQLAFYISNPISAGRDLLVNGNKNLYINANYQDFIAAEWKIYAGFSYNHTLESGSVNTAVYDQKDDIAQQKLTVSKMFKNNSILTFGAEQFQSRRGEGYAGMHRQYADVLSAGFMEGELYLFNGLILKAGLRTEYTSYMKRMNLAPRTSFVFIPNVNNRFTLGYGSYYQKPDDSFLAQTSSLNYERADNYSLDYEFEAHSRSLRLETYYKNYGKLTKIITPVYSGFQAYGPPVYINGFNNLGKGYARGIDVFWRDQRTFPGGEYYVSYSFVDTKRDYIDFPAMGRPSFVPEHTFNLVGRKFITRLRSQLSGTYTYSSGRSYFNPVNPVFLGDKTRDFHNLSLGISYLPNWVREFAVVNFTITNILGFNQVYGYRYSYDGSRRETVLPPSKRGVLLSFLMNIGDGTFNH